MHERATERHLHAFALRKPGHSSIRQGGEAKRVEHVIDAAARQARRHAAQAREIGQVLACRQARIQAGVIEHRTEALLRSEPVGLWIRAVDQHTPRVGPERAGNHPEGRRFPRPVRAEQAGDAAVAQRE